MAFIEKKNPVVLNIKLTSMGRCCLAGGNLDFKYYAVGDSEIDYDFNREVNAVDSEYSAFDSTILQPVDKNPNILSFIPRNVSGDSYNELSTVPVTEYNVENQIEPLGFFTSGAIDYITDTNHVKQPDAVVDMSGVGGGSSLTLLKGPNYGTSGEEPAAGDLLMVKWSTSLNTTGTTVSKSFPTQNLWYQITGITSGSLGGGSVVVGLDRPIPNFSGLSLTNMVGAMIYYNEISFSGASVFNLSPTDYIDESIISFLQNSQCPTIVFPYWNMSIIHTQEIAGVLGGNLKYTQFKNRKFGGFVSYIQEQAPVNKRLGVIHYTNTSPANVYAEGLLLNTFKLEIPTVMWHKSPTKTMGVTLTPMGTQQTLAGLNTKYYDLTDESGFIVGKVFNGLKIAVIEDQELLLAMEYKSNRNFTLPDYAADTNTILSTAPPITGGTNVTWTTPYNATYETIVGTCTSCIICQWYCHDNTTNWVSFPVGTSVSCGNVCNAGYRVCGCNNVGAPYFYGGGINICACDIVHNCVIPGSSASAGGPPLYKWVATSTNVNDPDGVIFCGCITN